MKPVRRRITERTQDIYSRQHLVSVRLEEAAEAGRSGTVIYSIFPALFSKDILLKCIDDNAPLVLIWWLDHKRWRSVNCQNIPRLLSFLVS